MSNERIPPPNIQIAHAVMIFIAGSVLGAVFEEVITTFILSNQSLTLLIIFVCLVLISHMIFQLVKITNEMHHNIGLHVLYLDRERHGRATLFSESRKIVEKAKQSIFVLNSVITEFSEENEDDKVIRERDKYYDSLLERASEGVTYERVIQMKNNQTLTDVLKDKGYIKHFHRLFDLKEKNRNVRMGLIKSHAKRPSTFVLVDDETLIWQIDEFFETGYVRMYGIFIIQDPRHEITQHFRVFAESAKREGFGAVQSSELPPLA